MKICHRCGMRKPPEEFTRDKRASDGRSSPCHACRRLYREAVRVERLVYDREYRRTHRGQRNTYDRAYNATRIRPDRSGDIRAWARNELRKAIMRRSIVKPRVCSKCGIDGQRVYGHHQDYTKPLDVIWLCSLCHGELHQLPVQVIAGLTEFLREEAGLEATP